MMKVSAQRRRTKQEIPEEKQQELDKKRDVDAKMQELEQLR